MTRMFEHDFAKGDLVRLDDNVVDIIEKKKSLWDKYERKYPPAELTILKHLSELRMKTFKVVRGAPLQIWVKLLDKIKPVSPEYFILVKQGKTKTKMEGLIEYIHKDPDEAFREKRYI